MSSTAEADGIAEDFVAITNDDAKPGVVYIEGRVRDDTYLGQEEEMQGALEKQLSSSPIRFNLLDDILADCQVAMDVLGDMYQRVIELLQSLRIVEYLGPKLDHTTSFELSSVRIRLTVYDVYTDARDMDAEEVPQAEVILLPHVRFEGIWDSLVFEHDLKSDLIWIIYNTIRFASTKACASAMNPFILLHGPPGTGKTTLCQGLAQKISIRLSGRYKTTKLVEVKTATILSRFFGESAKQVQRIFEGISRVCAEEDDTFICVLMDEVESIAGSRQNVTSNGESQDSLRATNALLTGMDDIKGCPNVLFLCTSNFPEHLDSAFLDRCGLRQAVEPPLMEAQYEIVRVILRELMSREIVKPERDIPAYGEALLDEATLLDTIGSKLLKIIKKQYRRSIQSENSKISGRALSQLPEMAIKRYLRDEDCTIDMALSFIEKQLSELKSKKVLTDNDSAVDRRQSDRNERRGKKRKVVIECDEDLARELLTTLQDSNNASVRDGGYA